MTTSEQEGTEFQNPCLKSLLGQRVTPVFRQKPTRIFNLLTCISQSGTKAKNRSISLTFIYVLLRQGTF